MSVCLVAPSPEHLVSTLMALQPRHRLGRGRPTDDAFLARTSTDELLETAHDQLRLDGYTLWTWDTGTEHVAGWMTASSDDTAMRILAPTLGIDARPAAGA
ncbi:hypothetical protein E2F46_09670 [Luteimonas aestuarii]|uniref:DUF6630 domain-containing protein n=1 Tax=Luteimonas aestuarii TaxID=453837 RepID=A0A4R5TSZ1_9GAMM|nr:hypothetical protein [Luteimonas aestuarii]TDK23790.1 hypothetical protein E2F46_09670 [Luteimonas aestuarii]